MKSFAFYRRFQDRFELLTGSGSQPPKDTLKRRVYGRDREKNRFSVTGSAAIMLARRTLYCEYNVPVKVGMFSQRIGKCPKDVRILSQVNKGKSTASLGFLIPEEISSVFDR